MTVPGQTARGWGHALSSLGTEVWWGGRGGGWGGALSSPGTVEGSVVEK